MLQASHDAHQNQPSCVETFHNRENKQTTVGNLVAGLARTPDGRRSHRGVQQRRTGVPRGRTGASRDRVVQECRGRTGRRNVTAQECHAQGGMGRTDRRESCSWEPLHLTARGSRALTPGRVMEATGLPSSAGLPGIPNPAGPTGPLGALSRPESPRQPRAARKAGDPGLSGLARRGHNQG